MLVWPDTRMDMCMAVDLLALLLAQQIKPSRPGWMRADRASRNFGRRATSRLEMKQRLMPVTAICAITTPLPSHLLRGLLRVYLRRPRLSRNMRGYEEAGCDEMVLF